MKKLISTITCASILALSVIPAYAAEASDSTGLNCTVLGTDRIANNTLVFYSYNIDSSCNVFYDLKNVTTGNTQRIWFKDYIGHPHSINVGTYRYEPMIGVTLGNTGGSGGGGTFHFTDVAAKYEKVRFKLSDYSAYFNADGTRTHNVRGYGDHNFNFTEQVVSSEAKFASALVFESGGAVTCAAPDKNGYVEVYISKAIGRDVNFSTEFRHYLTPASGGLTTGGGGGINRGNMSKLITGNVNQKGGVSVDDVTELQYYLAKRVNLDASAQRAADTNADKKINIDDVTALQMYLANR